MFGRGKKATNLPAYSRYSACTHKSVEFDDSSGKIDAVELKCPRTEDTSVRIRVTADASNRSDESLKYEDESGTERKAFRSPKIAYQFLGSSAAATVCNGCEYATMRALDVSETRADLAEEQLHVAQNDLRRARANIALGEALQELEAIDAAHIHEAALDPATAQL